MFGECTPLISNIFYQCFSNTHITILHTQLIYNVPFPEGNPNFDQLVSTIGRLGVP